MADVPGNSNVGSIKSTESVEDVANMDEQPQQFPTAPSYTQPQDMTFSNILAMTQATHNMSRGVAQNIATGFPPYMMGINPALANRAVAPPGSRSINPALANKAVAPQGSRSINPALANRAVAPQGSRSNPGQTNAAPVYINQGGAMTMVTPQHPMFDEIQQRLAASKGNAGPVLFNRTEGGVLELSEEIGKMAQEDVEETVSDEVFSIYQNKEIIPGCKPHPGEIVEAGSLSALSLPDPTYPLADGIPAEVITSGKLSGLQLEGVIHACQRHQMVLPSGSRAGFLIGDAAGVGKGRQIAGTILDNYARGRTKHIWFSISTDLIVDARRDLTDLGCHIKVIEGAQQLDKETRVLGLPADFKEGVVFSTYATLVSSVQKGGAFSSGRHSRLQQLVEWCGGKQFDGCLIFDECHKAKNFVPGKEQASTKVALAVTSLQRMLPKARVLYCSATGVSDVKNMAFMERMGLWGDGAAFKSFDQFLETVHRKGLGVAEMLAMEMKTSGMYVTRSLSFKEAEFVTEQIALSKEQVKMYNTASHVWNELRKSLESAMERTGCSNTRIWSNYWASHQRFFKQLCMGIKVGSVVDAAKQALEVGHCVVIGLQTTGEASLESELSKNNQLTGFVSLCREILSRFIEQHFPIVKEFQSGSSVPVEDDWSVTAKQMLLGFTGQIELPNSTLDDIIDQLGGPDNVAELTGRRGRIVRYSPGEPPRYVLRDADSGNMESLNVRERNAFMAGKKLVAVISDAASTGISLHASLKCRNQRRRVHMTIELPWSADKAVQQLGRSHRSNQASGPLYKLMTTNLGGERRFAAAVATRLQSLGALTKGDRRAATGVDLAEFNFDTPYGRSALRLMYNSICQKQLASGVSLQSVTLGKFDFAKFNSEMTDCLTLMGVLEKDTLTSMAKVKDGVSGDVGKFLNRIFGLSVGRQNLIFNYFSQCLDSQVVMAKREGRYNEGLVDITASSLQLVTEPREVFKARNTTNNPTKHMILQIDRGLRWDLALKRLENNPGDENGFYSSRRENRGKRLYILATLKESSKHLFKIARPNTGVSSFDEEKTDLLHKYMPITVEKAKKGWCDQYEAAKSQCIHGPQCRAGYGVCTVGSRCYKMHLLCGGIVTMMSLLESTIARYGPRLNLTKAESTLRVVRAKLDSGERVVGIRYPEILIPMVEKHIKEEDLLKTLMAKQQSQVTTNGVQTMYSQPASDNPDNGVLQTCIIEPVSKVIAKLLKKAMTPPVTMKSFFKSMTKETVESSEDAMDTVTKEEVTSETVTMDTVPKGDVIGDILTTEGGLLPDNHVAHGSDISGQSSGKRLTDGDNGGSDISGQSSGKHRTDGDNGGSDISGQSSGKHLTDGDNGGSDISGQSSGKHLTDGDNGTKGRSPSTNNVKPAPSSTPSGTSSFASSVTSSRTSSFASSGARGVKRPAAETDSRRGKKSRVVKQTSIMSLFSKSKSQTEVAKAAGRSVTVSECPVCGHRFPASSLNIDVNKHVDNCLIT